MHVTPAEIDYTTKIVSFDAFAVALRPREFCRLRL
jgi:hypothetical protein